MIELFILAASKTGDFGQDIILPSLVGTIIFLIILQQVLNRWGYALW